MILAFYSFLLGVFVGVMLVSIYLAQKNGA